jgi:hypothetical protein
LKVRVFLSEFGNLETRKEVPDFKDPKFQSPKTRSPKTRSSRFQIPGSEDPEVPDFKFQTDPQVPKSSSISNPTRKFKFNFKFPKKVKSNKFKST